MSTNVEGQVSAQIDTKQMLAEVAAKSHCTTVIGMDETGKCVFLKSYDYSKQKDEAQADLKMVIDAGLGWRICAISQLTVSGVYRDAMELIKEISEDKYLVGELGATGYDVKALLAGEDWRL